MCYQWVWQAGAALQTSLVAHQDLSQLAASPLAFSLRDKLVPKPSVAAMNFLEEVHDYAQAQNRKVSQLRAKLALKLDGLGAEAKKLIPWHTDVSLEIASLEEVLSEIETDMEIAEALTRHAARLVLSSSGKGEQQMIHFDEALRRVPAADQTVLPDLVADEAGWDEVPERGLVHDILVWPLEKLATNRVLASIETTEYDRNGVEVSPELHRRWTRATLGWRLEQELGDILSGALLVQIRLTDRGIVIEQVLKTCPLMLTELPDLTIPETWSWSWQAGRRFALMASSFIHRLWPTLCLQSRRPSSPMDTSAWYQRMPSARTKLYIWLLVQRSGLAVLLGWHPGAGLWAWPAVARFFGCAMNIVIRCWEGLLTQCQVAMIL